MVAAIATPVVGRPVLGMEGRAVVKQGMGPSYCSVDTYALSVYLSGTHLQHFVVGVVVDLQGTWSPASSKLVHTEGTRTRYYSHSHSH